MEEELANRVAADAAAEATAEATAKTVEGVKKMLKDNVSLEKVAQYSNLPLEEIEKIKKDNNL